ncbi:MAG: hypothetical protein N3H30_01440 [Candidatus Micrarchaeota archaeon]|nr:hypothetical protein [Candidatus Micrarchaeota archaeon]
MALKKSVRTRHRYIKFRTISQRKFAGDEIYSEILRFVSRTHGAFAMPKMRLISYENSEGILKCRAQDLTQLRAALALLTSREYRIKLLSSSGTIKALSR